MNFIVLEVTFTWIDKATCSTSDTNRSPFINLLIYVSDLSICISICMRVR